MKTVLAPLVLLVAAVTTTGCQPSDPDAYVIRGVSVIDVETSTASAPLTIVVSGNRITEMGLAGELRGPRDAKVIEGEGRFVIPGLWDMHVHSLQDGVRERMFPMFLANGVTGVRDMNGPMPLAEIHALRESVLDGDVLGPRFVAPGPLLDGPGRGPGALGPMVRWVDTPEKARDSVRALADRGADFIKPYNRITPDLYEAILDEANAIGIPVMGHVPMSVDPFVASEAGQASMEHNQGVLEGTSTEGPALFAIMEGLLTGALAGATPTAEDAARLFAARQAIVGSHDPPLAEELYAAYARNSNWQCVTLTSNRVVHLVDFDDSFRNDPRLRFIPAANREQMEGVSFLRGFGSPDEAFMRQRWEEGLMVVDEMDAAGVPILAGTDTGAAYTYAGFSLHDELELLVEAGLTTAAALRAATIEPARLLGATDSLGTVAPGFVADLVLLDANPLEDIGNSRSIHAVIANGRLLDRAALDALLVEAEAFAASDAASAGAVR